MLYKFTHAHISRMVKPPKKEWWNYVRIFFCLWFLLMGILCYAEAQNQILGLKFDTYRGNERFGLIEADDFIHPGLVTATDSATAIVSRSSGITRNAIEAFEPESYAACSWSTDNTIDAHNYFNIRITPDTGNVMNLTRFKLFLQRNQYGPTKIAIRSDVTGDADLLTQILYFDGTYELNIDLTSFGTDFQSLSRPVNFHVYGWEGSEAPDQENCLRIENADEDGYDLEVEGCVSYLAIASFVNPLERPTVVYKHPIANGDTICSGDTINLDFELPESLSDFFAGEYEFVLSDIRYEASDDLGNGGTINGYGNIITSRNYQVGDTVTHGLQTVLTNPTDHLVKIMYQVSTVPDAYPTCEAEPYRWISLIIMPSAPQLGISWVVNEDTLDNDTITVCVNDMLTKMMVNLSEGLDMIFRQITDVATYDMSVSAGDTINSIPIIMKEEIAGMNDTVVLVTYPDINKNGKLDPIEMACPSDTMIYIINVPEPILFTLQPISANTCAGDSVIFTASVSGENGGEWQYMFEEGWTSMGETDTVLTYPDVDGSMGGRQIRYAAYNVCDTVYSDTVALGVDTDCNLEITDSATLNVDSVSAGTLIPETITCMDTTLDLSASHGDMPFAPTGYDTLYVLTKGDELIIMQTDITTSFTVTDTGTYTIHTLVGELVDESDPNYIDLEGMVDLGVTPASDVVSAIQTQELCADLDVTGARFEVKRCNTIGTCENLTIIWEITDWDADNAGADPYNHVLNFNEKFIDDTQEDHPLLSRFTLDGTGQIIMRNDTAIVTGVVTSQADSTAKLDMMLVLTSPRNYDEWSESGRTWLVQLPEANAAAFSDYPNWTYWIVDTTSRLTGLGSLTGTQLSLSHAPADSTKGMQQGLGANDKDGDLGFGGWFMYEGDVIYNGNTTYIYSQGNLNSDLVSSDTICGLPIIGPIINNFTVQAVSDDAVQIVWSTLTDGNGGYIVVEKSVDGQIFEQVTVMEGTNGHFNPEVHSLTDIQDGGEGKFYYRLKVVKPSGTFAYTNVVEVTLDGILRQAYMIYPNPVVQGSLNIQVMHPENGVYFYEVYQLDGRRLICEELDASGVQIDVDHLSSGMYLLRIIDPDGSEHTQRISVNP